MDDLLEMDTIVALSAAVTAVAALVVSVWQGAETRKHNRLSVTPRIRFDFVYRRGEKVRFQLMNRGIGPAIVSKFAVNCDKRPVEPLCLSAL